MAVWALSALWLCAPPAFAASGGKQVRWLAAHGIGNERVLHIVREFGQSIGKQTNGALSLNVVGFEERDLDNHGAALRALYRGESEASQISLAALERIAPEVAVLSMPYVFRDFSHAVKVLDGEVGRELLKKINEGSNGKIRALAFTFSGGIRHFYGNREVRRPEDLAGARMADATYGMGRELADRMGVKLVADPLYSKKMVVGAFRNKKIDLMEDEYNRILATNRLASRDRRGPAFSVISETGHSLFATAILVNEAFFQSLSAEERSLLETEATKMAQVEREVSIRESEVSQAAFASMPGVKIVKVSEAERARFAEAAQGVYEKYEPTLGALVRRIRDVK